MSKGKAHASVTNHNQLKRELRCIYCLGQCRTDEVEYLLKLGLSTNQIPQRTKYGILSNLLCLNSWDKIC